MPLDDDVVRVTMLVKAFRDEAKGARIYTVEAVEVRADAGIRGAGGRETVEVRVLSSALLKMVESDL